MTTKPLTHTGPVVSITPNPLYFGVISSGFVYYLRFTVKNNLTKPLRIRVVVTPKDGELNALRLLNMPERIFPGLSIELCVELTAEYPNNSSFDMKLSQNFNDETCESVVEATVVTVETFKHVKKSLQLQKRPIYRPNVSVAGNCASYFEERSSTTPTTVSEIVLDDDDIDEMLEYPFAPNVFWDPFSKLLRVDPQLSKVIVGVELSHDESKQKTEEMREERLQELEDQGFYTYRSIKTLNNPNVRKKHNSFGEYEAAKLPHLNNAQGEDDDAASTQNSFQSSSHMMSVTSLLALKRERIEQQRRATIKAADDFSHSKSKESVDHARRTLNVLSHKQRMSGKTLPSKLM